MSDEVTISRGFYNTLLTAYKEILALEKAGVGYWEGYNEAMRELNEGQNGKGTILSPEGIEELFTEYGILPVTSEEIDANYAKDLIEDAPSGIRHDHNFDRLHSFCRCGERPGENNG